MKTIVSYLTAILLLGAAVIPRPAQAEVDIDFFYDSLAPYGSWMDVGDYGYVWRPDVDDEWEPYSDGNWVYTDAGWTWQSNEPYSWAVYHYGRWAQLDGIGWIWVPDNEWGPAWVSWRRSPDYVGWAPLPPEARFVVSIGLSNWVDSYYDIGPGRYRFVDVRNFGSRDLRTVFINRRENYSIINRTTNITNITYENNRIFNRGPDFDVIARRSERPIPRYRLDRRQDFDGDPRSMKADDFRSRQEGDALRIFAPRIGFRSVAPPRQVKERVTDVKINRGWKGPGIPQEETKKIREKFKAEAKAPDSLPQVPPRFQKPTAADATPGGDRDRGSRPDRVPRPGDLAPGSDKPMDRRPDATIPGKPTVDDTPGSRPDRPGKGRSSDDATSNRAGKGRPSSETTTPDMPGKGRLPNDENKRPGKGRPDRSTSDQPLTPTPERTVPMTPTTPKADVPDRPSKVSPETNGVPPMERRPKTDRRSSQDLPSSAPKIERPAIEKRPDLPEVKRPEMPARPNPQTVRPTESVERPAAPRRPTAKPDLPKPLPEARPQVDAPRPSPKPQAAKQDPTGARGTQNSSDPKKKKTRGLQE